MTRWWLPWVLAVLSACSSAPVVPPRADHLLHDHLFAPRPAAADPGVFALSAEMRQYLEQEVAPYVRRKGRLRGLVEALRSNTRLKLEYDAAWTRTAAEAFAARAGNCLSLVIMTAALAREIGVPVHYQRVYTEEAWTRDRQLLFLNYHVNIILGPLETEGFLPAEHGWPIVIDFVPSEGRAAPRSHEIAEHTIVAMFMSNRAAESLARGELDAAYWWVRGAIAQDPRFLASYNTLGVIYFRHGNPKEAEAAMNHVLQIEPQNTVALSNLVAVLEAQGRFEASRAIAARLRQLEPQRPFHFYDLAQGALEKRDFAAARDLFRRELERNPFNHQIHFGLASAYLGLGDVRAARRHLTIAMQNSTTQREYEFYAAVLDRLRQELN